MMEKQLKLKTGDVVLYNAVGEKYNFKTGWNQERKASVLYINFEKELIVTKINAFNLEIGFHISRFIKIIRHATGKQLDLFYDESIKI